MNSFRVVFFVVADYYKLVNRMATKCLSNMLGQQKLGSSFDVFYLSKRAWKPFANRLPNRFTPPVPAKVVGQTQAFGTFQKARREYFRLSTFLSQNFKRITMDHLYKMGPKNSYKLE